MKNMKKKVMGVIVGAVIAVASFAIGRNFPDPEIWLDMRTVVDYEANDTGLQLYTDDGNGYYWEWNVGEN